MTHRDPLPGPPAGLTLALRNARLDAHNAKQLAEFAREAGPEPDRPMLSMLGDERQLRGIPALARGVGGAIPGTRPGSRLR